jgi:hypothetical protein
MRVLDWQLLWKAYRLRNEAKTLLGKSHLPFLRPSSLQEGAGLKSRDFQLLDIVLLKGQSLLFLF